MNKTIYIIYKNKKGFSVPIDYWLKHQLKHDVKKGIFDEHFYCEHIVNIDAVKEYVHEFYNNEHNSAWGVWHIYAWQKWAINQNLI